MSESVGKFRLRKAEDGNEFGPLTLEELKAWAQESMIAPDDEILDEAGQSRVASEWSELEMFWTIKFDSGKTYGPTTLGTLVEFSGNGLVSGEEKVVDVRDQSETTLRALLGAQFREETLNGSESALVPPEERAADVFSVDSDEGSGSFTPADDVQVFTNEQADVLDDSQTLQPSPQEAVQDAKLEAVMETARELRIRQLESDVERLKKANEKLLQDYRKACEQIAAMRTASKS